MPTFDQIRIALNACMTAEPAIDYMLSKDASQLSTVFAEMMYFKETERPLDALTAKQASAYHRWVPAEAQAAEKENR